MRRFSVGTLLVVALVAAGCGGGSSAGGGGGTSSAQSSGESSKSAQQVVTDAITAADAAKSVRWSGQIADSGKKIAIDLTLVPGKGGTGSMVINGGKVDLILIGDTAYMRAGPSFWKHYNGPSAVGQLLSNKWLKFSANSAQFGSLTHFLNPKAVFNNLKSHGALTNEGAKTYKGQSVVAIHDASQNATLYVLNSGTPYPAAILKTGGSQGGTIQFSDWNQAVPLKAPAGALDFTKLAGGG